MMNEKDMQVTAPKASIGVPVYNGGKTLDSALGSLTRQSVSDIEIIISDNGSTDNTPHICKAYAARDPRIRYFRQSKTVCATENFKFVLNQARAPYFMWAAHDDIRDLDYVEKLMAALDSNPKAILAFGDVIQELDGVAALLEADFVNTGLSPIQRLRREALHPLHHLYGLWRTGKLKIIKWCHTDWWHDTPLMMAATMLGDYIYVPGVKFYYLSNRHLFFDWGKTDGLFERTMLTLRRSRDLGLLIWLCGMTVACVSGPGLGMVGAWLGLVKICHDIHTFIRHRSKRLSFFR